MHLITFIFIFLRANFYFLFFIFLFLGEFDRVHYPLPLLLENPETPNLDSWRRTINKLRKQVKLGNQEKKGCDDDQILHTSDGATSFEDGDMYVYNTFTYVCFPIILLFCYY